MKLPISIFEVKGNSMLPHLKPGDKVVSLNWFISFRSGDVIVTNISNKEIIKRAHLVKGGEVFLKGDNEEESTDSRSFGWVDKAKVIGKVIYILKA